MKIKYFFLLFVSTINVCLGKEMVIENASDLNPLYWNYAVRIKTEKTLYRDKLVKKFSDRTYINSYKDIVRDIIGLNYDQNSKFVKIYIEISETNLLIDKPILRIPLEFSKVRIIKTKEGKISYIDASDDDCCCTC